MPDEKALDDLFPVSENNAEAGPAETGPDTTKPDDVVVAIGAPKDEDPLEVKVEELHKQVRRLLQLRNDEPELQKLAKVFKV